MTTYSQTVNSTLDVFGPDVGDPWGAYNWGAFKWGWGTAGVKATVIKNLASDTITLSDTSTYEDISVLWVESLVLTSPLGNLEKVDSHGWSYGWTFPSTNAYLRPHVVWVQGTS